MLEEQRVLLEEKHKREDTDRLKRGLPQRWGTIKKTEEFEDAATSNGEVCCVTSLRTPLLSCAHVQSQCIPFNKLNTTLNLQLHLTWQNTPA